MTHRPADISLQRVRAFRHRPPADGGRRGAASPVESVPRRAADAGPGRDRLLKTAYALIINSGLSGVMGLLFWMIAARRYDPAVIGRNTAAISAMMTLSTVAQLDLASALMRFLPIIRRSSTRIVAGAYGCASVMTVVLSAGFVVVAPRVSHNLSFLDQRAIGLAFCLGAILWTVFSIEDGVLVGLQRAAVVPVENASYNVVKAGLLLPAAAMLPAWGIFAAWTAPLVAAIAVVNLLLFTRYLPAHALRPPAASRLTRRMVARYLSFDYLTGLFGGMQTMAMPLLVTVLLGATANGYFYVPWAIVVALDAVSLGLSTSLLVEGSYEPGSLAAFGRRVLRHLLVVLAPIVVVVVVSAPLIVSLFGSHYSGSANLLRLLAVGILPRSLFAVSAAVARVRNQVRQIYGFVMVGTTAMLGLSVLGAVHGGTITALCAGWSIGNVIVGIIAVAWLHRLFTRSAGEPVRVAEAPAPVEQAV